MSVTGVGNIGSIGALTSAQAVQGPQGSVATDGSPSAFFDMTSWTGPADSSVTVGPATAKASLPELSASVLSAILS